MRLLCCDDEPYVRETLGCLLNTLGHRAVIVASGEEAVRAYREAPDAEQFDACIFDMVLGRDGMDGFTAASMIRVLDHDARIVIVTGYDPAVFGEEARQHGFPILAKPYSLEDLSAVLQHVTAG